MEKRRLTGTIGAQKYGQSSHIDRHVVQAAKVLYMRKYQFHVIPNIASNTFALSLPLARMQHQVHDATWMSGSSAREPRTVLAALAVAPIPP